MPRILFFLLLYSSLKVTAQFKNDNVRFTTVFPEDLCNTIQANPGFLFLDVRSQGEFDDTLSSSGSLNIGHIRDAVHISVQELPSRWKELLAYKDRPLFVYCSHSQRSRRASKMLADSGFTRLFNINGGLTDFYSAGLLQKPCPGFAITNSLPYKLVTPEQLAENINYLNTCYIIDLRSDSAYHGWSQKEKVNSEGRFTKSVNIPFEKLTSSFSSLPRDKPLLLVDEYGNESAKAAIILVSNGFKDVSILFNGMDEWVDYSLTFSGKQPVPYTVNRKFNLLSANDFDREMKLNKELTVIDIRSTDEFNNQSKNSWENIGQVKNAINIPASQLDSSTLLPESLNRNIIVFAFGDPEYLYQAAAKLRKKGYLHVSVLRGGNWYLRWASHNLKGKEHLSDWIINVPEQNL